MIATSRVARQTNRWVRFAAVTVQVFPAVADEVTVAPGVLHDEAQWQEAVCGAHEALRHVPTGRGRHRVTVVDALTTEVDTGAGDVYEATAQAVRLALSLDPSPFASFSDPRMVTSWLRDRIGRRLVEVTEARYWNNGERDPDTAASLVHSWLHFDHRPPTQLHGCGDDVQLSIADPYLGYEMGQFGEVRVASAAVPDLLAGAVGRRLTDAAIILGPHDRPACAGLLLRLDEVKVAIGTFGDEWVLALDEPPTRLAPYWRLQPWIMQA
ncbi:hypothetical protein [Micromonospora polyrhachis]|uniref:Uncharacterized protein n=1 Tax=Micromonospora polyrhachis TaxID=1282883 RepID=A0A7W7SKS0_9ACTN|nr:hypothetical protein [Micromonospora polyrhachis]MBB4956608.1 hypothetical protein [Micromonospora polyrhachis]